jgi:hypothetical protein
MSDFQKTRPGEPIKGLSSRAWNRMLDTVNPGASINNPEAFEPRPINFSIIGFNPATGTAPGTAVPQWGCVCITGVRPAPSGTATGTALQQFERQPAIVVGQPTAETGGRFAVALEPVGGGRSGLFAIDGVVQVKLDVLSTTHKFATPKVGTAYRMESADAGEATILWADNATTGNDRWALVRIGSAAGGSQVILGKITGTWTKGTTATVYKYSGDTATGITGPSGALATVTGVNRFATVNVVGTGPTGPKWVALGLIGATWHLIAAECSG